jgi:ferredoxin-type protein NapF
MRCLPACDMGAISDDPTRYSGYECIDCFGCEAVCPEAAITLRPAIGAGGRCGQVDLSRRRLVQAAAFGGVGVVLMKTELGARPIDQSVHQPKIKAWDPQLIRPPGAAAEDKLVASCVRCGECMRVCPTNGIQPALGEAGLEGVWTPVLIPRIGPCAAECTACGQVCPTDALAPFTEKEKPWIYLGTASIDRSTCLVWSKGRQCLICDEYCSYDAIYWKENADGQRAPHVDEFRCVGCGLCEKACPIQPLAAIRVFSTGDRRDSSRDEQHRYYLKGQALSRELREGEVPAPSTVPAESSLTKSD